MFDRRGLDPRGLDPRRLVFVGGLHRSGTTPFTRTLATHPEVSGLTATGVMEDEGQHLQSVYPPGRAHGGPGRFAHSPEAHLTEDSPLATPANAQLLYDTWAPYWDLDRRLLVEKSPPNLVMSRFLQELFPGSAYIAVLRHPVVVALSTVKWRPWHNYESVFSMVGHWVAAHDIFRRDAARLRRVHVLRYEDLVAAPDAELARVATYLGLGSPIPSDTVQATRSQQYEDEWGRMARSWLKRPARRRIVRTYGEAVAAFGYDIEDLHQRTSLTLGH